MNLFNHSALSFLICALSLILGSGVLETLLCMAFEAVMLSGSKRPYIPRIGTR